MESELHKKLKIILAGDGVTEYPLSDNRRIDSVNDNLAGEVELSGNISDAISRLKAIDRETKVIAVPEDDAESAAYEMAQEGVNGYVLNTNLDIIVKVGID